MRRSQLLAVHRVAARQHGVVTREALLAAGMNAGMIRRWLAAGRLEPVHAGVYRIAGAPRTWEHEVAAAVLAGKGLTAASHRTAARLWDLLDGDVVEVSVPRNCGPRTKGVIVHRSRDLADAVVVRRRGIPTTNPLRTVLDLGAVVGLDVVEAALEQAMANRLVTLAGVEAELARAARRGRRGAGVLRGVLERRALGARPPDSVLEARLARVLRGHRLPPAEFQYEVRHDGRFVARVDFAYPAVRLAIEVDGHETHSSRRALQHDLSRQNALVAAGWTVLRFTWEDVVRRPAQVAASIRAVLGGLRAG